MRRRGAYVCAVWLALVAPAAAAWGAVRVGDTLPAAVLSDWQGGRVNLALAHPRVLLVDFWASWCEPCREVLPRLDAIARQHAADGLRVFAVNIDTSGTQANAFLATYLPTRTLTLLRDPGGSIMARFGAAGMPMLYVVDRRGVVRLITVGFTAEKLRSVEQSVEQLLAEPEGQPQ